MTPQQYDNLLAWIIDLETTDAPQTRGRLHLLVPSPSGVPAGFCCLGRACVVMGLKSEVIQSTTCFLDPTRNSRYPLMDAAVSSQWLKDTFGDEISRNQIKLMRMNDQERNSFKQIAAYLRTFLPKERPQ